MQSRLSNAMSRFSRLRIAKRAISRSLTTTSPRQAGKEPWQRLPWLRPGEELPDNWEHVAEWEPFYKFLKEHDDLVKIGVTEGEQDGEEKAASLQHLPLERLHALQEELRDGEGQVDWQRVSDSYEEGKLWFWGGSAAHSYLLLRSRFSMSCSKAIAGQQNLKTLVSLSPLLWKKCIEVRWSRGGRCGGGRGGGGRRK